MRGRKRHKLGLETDKGVQLSGITPQFSTPNLLNLQLSESLEVLFGRRTVQELKGVGEVILVADLLDLNKPRLGAIRTCGEGMLQTLIVNLILKRFLRNLREMSRFSSESDKILFIRYRVSKKYGGERLKMTHQNRK